MTLPRPRRKVREFGRPRAQLARLGFIRRRSVPKPQLPRPSKKARPAEPLLRPPQPVDPSPAAKAPGPSPETSDVRTSVSAEPSAPSAPVETPTPADLFRNPPKLQPTAKDPNSAAPPQQPQTPPKAGEQQTDAAAQAAAFLQRQAYDQQRLRYYSAGMNMRFEARCLKIPMGPRPLNRTLHPGSQTTRTGRARILRCCCQAAAAPVCED